jgi:uncharacterized protein YlxW (UPF0749 family)
VNPFVQRFSNSNQGWIWPVSGMCIVLGFMISLAWVTKENRNVRYQLLPADQRERITQAAVDIEAFQKLTAEVEKLRQEKTEAENTLANSGKEAQVLNKSLQELKVFAAMTKVEGPGLVVTLRDSARNADVTTSYFREGGIIHDTDVLKTVNELFASGAEAVSVNNHRVGPGSTFRCVGPTILVNDIKIASPVVVRAIGDADTLFGGMNLPGGVLDEIRQDDPAMVQVEKVKMQELPAYVGKTSFRYISVPEDKSAQ